MSHVDLATGKIYNCTKGSWLWWHEKGHIEYNKLPISGEIQVRQNYLFMIWMVGVTLSCINKWFLILNIPLVIIYILTDVYEERWCNKYADKHFYDKNYKKKPLNT